MHKRIQKTHHCRQDLKLVRKGLSGKDAKEQNRRPISWNRGSLSVFIIIYQFFFLLLLTQSNELHL
jgi:hypothetical protein